jgi:hypothetical protein
MVVVRLQCRAHVRLSHAAGDIQSVECSASSPAAAKVGFAVDQEGEPVARGRRPQSSFVGDSGEGRGSSVLVQVRVRARAKDRKKKIKSTLAFSQPEQNGRVLIGIWSGRASSASVRKSNGCEIGGLISFTNSGEVRPRVPV